MTAAAPLRLRDDPAHLRAMLGDARAQLVDAEGAIGVLVAALGYVTARRAEVPHDVDAERRVLGAYLLGRVSPRALCDVPAQAFEGVRLAAPLLALAELERSSSRELRPALAAIPREGPLRRRAIVALLEQLDADAAAEAEALPWPAGARDELAEVRSRARRRAALEGSR